MNLVSILKAGRRDFLDAARGVSAARPSGGGWSAVECVEHVVRVEERYFSWLARNDAAAPPKDAERELRLFSIARSRLTKIETPEVLRPSGRFADMNAALAEFCLVRDRSIGWVQEKGETIYTIGATHPYFGDVNGAELVQVMDGHARRHADQIREIAEVLVS